MPSFLLLIGSSSKDIRPTSIGRETFSLLISHENQIFSSTTKCLSSYRTLFPRIWAWCHSMILLGRIQYCPRLQKVAFGWRASYSKRLCSASLGLKCWSLFTRLSQLCWIISWRQLYLHFSFSLDLLNLRQGAWIRCNPVHARRLHIPWKRSSS